MSRAGEDGAGAVFDLAGAVRAADPATLLPERRAGEEARLTLPLRMVDALALPGAGFAPAPAGWAALVVDAAGSRLAVPLVRDDTVPGRVRRARAGDGAAQALLGLLADSAGSPSFDVTTLHRARPAGESSLDVDQTHDSVVVGAGSPDAVVVKWAVHVDPACTRPPSVTALQHLDAVGFSAMPRPVGFLVHGSADGHELVASAAQYLPGALDGWDWYVDDLLGSLAGWADGAQALQPATLMGELVGRLHTAFATAWADCPQPVTRAGPQDAERWLRRALDTVAEAEEVTSGAAGERFRSRSAAAGAVVRAGLSAASGTPMTRVHGDLHVGQVLRWAGGYAVSDFDGNPVLPAAERDLPQPPARDVAGMLRALDHVGRIVDRRTEHAYDGRVRDWAATARRMFLSGYRAELARAGLENIFDPRLLAAFEVEQECRELVYAARHLPRWTYVPDAALTELLPMPGDAHG